MITNEEEAQIDSDSDQHSDKVNEKHLVHTHQYINRKSESQVVIPNVLRIFGVSKIKHTLSKPFLI